MKKKLLAILLSGAMAMTLAACGGDTTGDTTTDTDASGDGAATAGSYTVGICQQMQHAALDQATQGFQDKLTELVTAAGGSVEFELDNASGESANAATIVNGFVSSGVDLIMANGTTSLQAAQSGTVDIPILGTSITDYATALQREDWSGTSGTNISGTTDLAPLEDQAQMILDLFPEAENVGLLYCSAEPNSVYQVDIVRAYLEGQGITCTDYTFADSNDLASVAQSACTTSDAIYIPTDNTAASYASTIHNVVVPAGVPVITGDTGTCSAAAWPPWALTTTSWARSPARWPMRSWWRGPTPAPWRSSPPPPHQDVQPLRVRGAEHHPAGRLHRAGGLIPSQRIPTTGLPRRAEKGHPFSALSPVWVVPWNLI